jgi:hypothetical protein
LRIPYGLDRLPRSIALDDPRLPSMAVSDAPLRLNSEPVPPDAMPLVVGDHTSRVAAAQAWLESQCGDYAPLRRQFIVAYFRFVGERIEAQRTELTERLKRYDGLYAPEDYLWSALRPLPRGWVPAGAELRLADIVFWTGTRVIAIELTARDRPAGFDAGYRIEPAGLTRLGAILPPELMTVWADQRLPSSPFRRPRSPVMASLRSQ